MRGMGRAAGRGDGRLVGLLTFAGRVGAVLARDAAAAGAGRLPASDGNVVGRSPFGRSGRSPGGTTTTGG
jgi:hypothetical protein